MLSNLNEILSLMYRMDKEYGKAVNLNEGSLAHTLLVEDKRINQARQRSRDVIRQVLSDEELTDEQVEEKLRKFEDAFYHDPRMRSSAVMRLEPLFCRLACFYDGNDMVLAHLQTILKFLFKNQNQIDLVSAIPNERLYTLTYDELADMFEEQMESVENKESQEQTQDEKDKPTLNDYEIVGPLDYETAHEIGNQSCPDSHLCYTQSKGTWVNYTREGKNSAYAVLKKGWENIPPEHDKDFVSPFDPTQTPNDNSPYDTYGLSMIFVFVGPNGELTTCNTRWNHEAAYPSGTLIDNALNKKQISEIIGMNFSLAFGKGDDSDFIYKLKIAKENLKNGNLSGFSYVEPLTKDNKHCYAVELSDRWNVVVDGKIKYKQWFNTLTSKNIVQLDEKYNILNNNGDLIWNIPYSKMPDYIEFRNDLGWYYLNKDGKGNFYDGNTKGLVISKIWFDGYIVFDSNRIRIKRDGKFNLIVKDKGCIIKGPLEDWFDGMESLPCTDDYVVRKNGNYNILNLFGDLKSDVWFDFVDTDRDFYSNHDYYRISINKKLAKAYKFQNRIEFIEGYNQDFYDRISKSENIKGCYIVRCGHMYNLLDENFNLVSKTWFNRINVVGPGLMVVVEDKYNFMRPDRTYVLDEWVDYMSICPSCDFIIGKNVNAYNERKYNMVSFEGKLHFNEWLDTIKKENSPYSHELLYLLIKDGKVNYMRPDFTLLWDAPPSEWFERMYESPTCYWTVNIGTKCNLLHNGKLVWQYPLENWFNVMVGPITEENAFHYEYGEFWCWRDNDECFTVVKNNKILGLVERNKIFKD